MAEQQAPRFLTVAEVAELIRVSKMTVYRMVHAGEIPAVRVGRSFRVPQAAVEELLASGVGDWQPEREARAGG
jgi:excisionase family DNA binding protein